MDSTLLTPLPVALQEIAVLFIGSRLSSLCSCVISHSRDTLA